MATWMARTDSRYSEDQWKQWYHEHEFGRGEMGEILRQWTKDFEKESMHQDKAHEICLLRAGSRKEKHKGRRETRESFRAWLKEKYASSSLAKAVVKFPFPNRDLSQLLMHWDAFILTADYRAARERSFFETNPGKMAANLELKLRVHRLRNKRKRALAVLKPSPKSHLSYTDRCLIKSYQSGELDKELKRLTLQYGFGRFWREDGSYEDVAPTCFLDYVSHQGE